MMNYYCEQQQHNHRTFSSYEHLLSQYNNSIMDDTQEAATFLLTLKHSRSVTPEPEPPFLLMESTTSKKEDKKRKRNIVSSATSMALTTTTTTKDTLSHPDCNRNQTHETDPQESKKAYHPIKAQAEQDQQSLQKLLGNSSLVTMKDRSLVPDALFVAMGQMKQCKLTEADRVGCYKAREIGFIGMCCKHCNGRPGFGRYYPNSIRSLAQTTTSQTILKHISSKCRFCPPDIRKAVKDLMKKTPTIDSGNGNGNGASRGGSIRPRYGSRKIFFQRVWSRLQSENDDLNNSKTQQKKQIDYITPRPQALHRNLKRKNALTSNNRPQKVKRSCYEEFI